MANLRIQDLKKTFGALEIIKGVNLEIDEGEFVVFVGPSGCGKSTLLRMIAGLEDISSGQLWIGDHLCNEVAPRDRGIAMVFQNYALYPHMTVAENIGFGLKLAGESKESRRQKIEDAARMLQIEPLLERKPSQLSGGQRQRVAIGRAIVRKPGVFLFDEPLSNLDAALRVDMRMEIARLHADLGATMIYVTHDQVEAMTLADKIVVLRDGVIQQVGSPIDLYQQPENLFVAGFIGHPKMNFLNVAAADSAQGGIVLTSGGSPIVSLPASAGVKAGDELTIGIRPHDLRIAEEGMKGAVRLVERLGNETIVNVEFSAGTHWLIVLEGDRKIAMGQQIGIALDPNALHLFDRTGRRIHSH